MKFLASPRWRIFIVAWLLYSVHFATNVVREHYPAFSLVDHGTFRVDEYQGFHPDIFVHRDGHSVIGNQVLVSVLAAVPLWIFDPVLDAVERYNKERLAEHGVEKTEYRTEDHPNSRAFYDLVRERGLELRFGAATVVTSVFFMAPLTAAFLVFFYGVLRRIRVEPPPAATLTLLLGFGTPIFFRAASLNHNMFVMYWMFASFALLWLGSVSRGRTALAGMFGGLTLATDYIGVIILPLLYGYLLTSRARVSGWRASIRESFVFVAGSVPPILFLLYSQWAMYGNPFLPGQYWMPDQNIYTDQGMRGFDWPAPDLVFENLFHPGFGLFLWAPILLLAFIPVLRRGGDGVRHLASRERCWIAIAFVVFLTFCSANQYARLQFNSGFRYLLPMVPFLFLALVDTWMRLPRWARWTLGSAAVVNSWVLTAFRESIGRSWALFLQEGVQLPWFRVLRMTSPPDAPLLSGSLVPSVVLVMTVLVCVGVWTYGNRLEAAAAAARSRI